MIDRRDFILALGATGLLTACQSGPPKPSVITVNLAGDAGMNPGPGGGDRPVTVMILRLKSTGAFNSADYFALQGGAGAALGGDLIGSDTISVGPGKTAAMRRVISFRNCKSHSRQPPPSLASPGAMMRRAPP